MARIAKYDVEIINLKQQGLSGKEIAEKLGITVDSVYKCVRRHRLSMRFPPKHYKPRIRPNKSPFSIIVDRNIEFINIKLLPTSEWQAKKLLKMLEDLGGEVI